jgi:hypothetical protein
MIIIISFEMGHVRGTYCPVARNDGSEVGVVVELGGGRGGDAIA